MFLKLFDLLYICFTFQKLRPSNGRYESGEHYCSISREESRKSAHGHVTFHRDGDSGEKFAIKTLMVRAILYAIVGIMIE